MAGLVQRVQVGIVGAGPAGLLLGQLLHRAGISNVILEQQTRSYVEARIRAGVLEQGAVDLMAEAGVDERLRREGLVHRGIEIAVNGRRQVIDMTALTGGKAVTVYGQTEVTKDLIAARLSAGLPLVFEAADVKPQGFDGTKPFLTYVKDGAEHRLDCDFIAGCDGFHGICRQSVPQNALTIYERVYPFAWLGILSESKPAADELIYARHERGFALFSMRSPILARNYIQCAPDEDLAQWPDERIWDELRLRLGDKDGSVVQAGRLLDKSVTPMRSFVAEPLRFGRLLLAGDAGHIVPPTGAKGLNLAAADIRYLSRALIEFYTEKSQAGLNAYSEKALRRIWKAQRFSWWMTSLLHKFPETSAFDDRVRLAELEYILGSQAGLTTLAENYVGLPFEA